MAKEKNGTELVKSSTELVTPKEFEGFDRQEVVGAMGESGGYLSNYGKLIIADGVENEFRVIDMTSDDTDNVVQRFQKSEVVLYYAHSVYRLRRGTIEGASGDRMTWDDRQKEIVAMSYDSPFTRGANKSRGNFDPNYSEYLTKENKENLESKVYAFMQIPKLFGLEILAASFGITAWKSIGKVRKKLNSLNLPLPTVVLEMSLVSDQNDNKQKYKRVNFEILKKDDQPVMSIKSKDEYFKIQKKALEHIEAIHKSAVHTVENSEAIATEEKKLATFDEIDENEIKF